MNVCYVAVASGAARTLATSHPSPLLPLMPRPPIHGTGPHTQGTGMACLPCPTPQDSPAAAPLAVPLQVNPLQESNVPATTDVRTHAVARPRLLSRGDHVLHGFLCSSATGHFAPLAILLPRTPLFTTGPCTTSLPCSAPQGTVQRTCGPLPLLWTLLCGPLHTGA